MTPTRPRAARTLSILALAVIVLSGLFAGAAGAAGAAAPTDNVQERGDAGFFGSNGTTVLGSPVVGMDRTPSGLGYWTVTMYGQVYAFGDAVNHGSPPFVNSFSHIVDIAAHPTSGGYLAVAARGDVFVYGSGWNFILGGPPGLQGGDEIVAAAVTAAGNGYYLLSRNGLVFTYGSASFFGAPVGLTNSAVDIVPTSDGLGYWIVSADGVVRAYGSAVTYGSVPSGTTTSVTGMTRRPANDGYWLVDAAGTVYAFGAAANVGGMTTSQRVVDIASTPSGAGYWLASAGNALTPGTITGTVRNAANDGLAGICVSAYATNQLFQARRTVRTDANGFYSLSPLPTNTYKLAFTDCINGLYLGEWFNDQPTIATSNNVGTADGSVTSGIDATLTRGSTITGVVTSPSGPIAGACVKAYRDGAQRGEPGTSVTGNYVLVRASVTGLYKVGGLPNGSYRVQFDDCGSLGYFGEWWDDKTVAATSDVVPLGTGEDVNGIDAELAPAGVVAGIVTNGVTGQPAPSICVAAEDADNQVTRVGFTTVTGYYRLSPLTSGAYKINFTDCSGNGLAEEWNSDKLTRQQADPVSVTEGSTTPVNATLVLGGSISGVVATAASPGGISGACVTAYDGSRAVTGALTTSTGYYLLRGLKTGGYTVKFRDCAFTFPARNLAPEWWDDAPDHVSSDPIPVTNGATTSGINAMMSVGGTLSGVVTDGQGNPALNVCVAVHDANGTVNAARTTTGGAYLVSALPTGEFHVSFNDCEFNFANRTRAQSWYGDAAAQRNGDTVSVTLGQDTTGINGVISPGGAITGVVKSPTGTPLAGLCVVAVEGDHPTGIIGITSVTGFYRLGWLRTGGYDVRVDDCQNQGWRQTWYGDSATRAGAANVNVNAPATTTGRDVTLPLEVPRAPRSTYAPALTDDDLSTGQGPRTIDVLMNDRDPNGDLLRIIGWDNARHGSVSCTVEGQCTYTPTPGYTGADFFGYAVSDGYNMSMAVVRVVVQDSGSGYLRVATNPSVPSQVLVNGVPRDTYGLTWMKLPAGAYEVCFTDVEGYVTPACQQTNVLPGSTSTVTGEFLRSAGLRVTTSPALPATITVDGMPRNDWGMWTDIPVPLDGDVEVCFGAVADYQAPPCQTVDLTAGSLSEAVGTYTLSLGAPGPVGKGSLRATTSPSLPAQISVDGVPADRYGLTWLGLDAGPHEVCFGTVAGFSSPGCQVVNVVTGETTTLDGVFVPRGYLRVITSPALPATVVVDGVARNDWGMWTDLPVGPHSVCAGTVPGWTGPACQVVNVVAGTTTTFTANYTI